MKTRLFLLLAFVVTGLHSCKTAGTSSDPAIDKVAKMKVSNIFRKDSVNAFLSTIGPNNETLSKEYIEKAERIRKDDFEKAVYYYKRAITILPDDKTYIQLGNVLMEKEQYDQAQEVFQTAVNLNPSQPGEQQYVKMIKNNLLSSDDFGQYFFLDYFHKLGYKMETLQAEVIGNEKIKTSVSQIKIKDFISSMNNVWEITVPYDENSGASFETYLKQFEPVTLPFVCTQKELQRFVYANGNEEFENYDPATDFTRFSENSLFKTNYYCKTDFQYFIMESNNHFILLQAVDTSGTSVPRDMRCVYHRLMVYSKEGKLTDSKIIGTQAGETLITYSIQPDLTINRESFVRTWKKPFKRYDLDNELVSVISVPVSRLKITESGTIIEENTPQ